jgi:tRNA(fMet)-specific endonuclease VapC
MNYTWDTNILLNCVRDDAFYTHFDEQFNFFAPQNTLSVSAVVVGEIRSIALRNKWGNRRLERLAQFLATIKAIPITDNEALINMYAEIDAYSQNLHPKYKLNMTPRNMGKNDLWIAATTAVNNAVLITLDKNFDHLAGVFLNFKKINF